MGKKLVAIVGAGASKELGLPIGSELKANISKLLKVEPDAWRERPSQNDYGVCEALRIHAASIYNGQKQLGPFIADLHHISDAMPQAVSIDHFIHDQRGRGHIEICGKIGIARAILQSERASSLYLKLESRNEAMDFTATESTWLNPFARIVTQSCAADELEERFASIGLIIFNYDRCVEHFLYHWLRRYYRIDHDLAAKLVRSIEIYHPYGTVGSLPWEGSLSRHSVDYGGDLHPQHLLTVAREIKTFTEGTDPSSSEICGIRELVSNSEKVLFLGFAFHQLNLGLLRPTSPPMAVRREIYGTAMGVSEVDRRIIEMELSGLFNCGRDFVHLRNYLPCSKIFGEFNRGLSV